MSMYRFGDDYGLSYSPLDALDNPMEDGWEKVESVEIDGTVFVNADCNSRWAELFGTPERAARTLAEFELDQINWCHGTDGCEKCPYEFDRYGCCLPDGFSLLEWLRGDV